MRATARLAIQHSTFDIEHSTFVFKDPSNTPPYRIPNTTDTVNVSSSVPLSTGTGSATTAAIARTPIGLGGGGVIEPTSLLIMAEPRGRPAAGAWSARL